MPEDEDSEEASEHDEAAEAAAEVEAERMRQIVSKKGARGSVLAERTVFQADWQPPVYEKTPLQAKEIEEALSRSFMFKELPDTNLKQVIGAFAGPHVVTPGKEVIRQGDLVESGEPGLFVLERGRLDVFKKNQGDEHPGKRVFTYSEMGQSFGELALLYNCPRAATVICSTDAVLWSIDRDTFNHCVKDGYRKIRQRREAFIDKVEILSGLTPDERAKIVDVVQSETYSNGDTIIRVGEIGDRFYMVEGGKCVACINREVKKELFPGDYFGELALLKSQRRVADVIAVASPTVVGFLDGETFKRLLGPLSQLMEERAQNYEPLGGTRGSNTDKAQQESSSFLTRWLGSLCGCGSIYDAKNEPGMQNEKM